MSIATWVSPEFTAFFIRQLLDDGTGILIRDSLMHAFSVDPLGQPIEYGEVIVSSHLQFSYV